MALRTLKTDYKESTFVGDMEYELVNNGNNVYFIDQTIYTTNGDYLVAAVFNDTNSAINSMASLYSSWIGSYTALKTNYVDATYSGNKQYQMTTQDGYTILTDVTSYTQVGDNYGASDINAANRLLNTLSSNYTTNMDSIKSYLRALGATHVDDFSTALNEIVNYQTQKGRNDKIADMQAHPNNYRNSSNTYPLYSKAQYTAKQNSNTTLRNNMNTQKNNASSAKTNMHSNDAGINQMCDIALMYADYIVAGISSEEFSDKFNKSKNEATAMANAENQVRTTVINAINSIYQALGNLL
jgi:hypothetical protein